MKKAKYITGALMAFSLTLTGIWGCQSTPQTPSNPTNTVLNLNTQQGNIRLHIALPQAKSYAALEEYQGFHTQALEARRINKIKVTITHVSSDFKAEKVIPLSQGGMVATISVPLGKNYIISVQGMDDLNAMHGAKVKGVFTVESAEVTPDVDVTPTTTAVAEVLERVKARDAEAALKVDTDKLLKLVLEAKSAASPFLMNFDSFADAIIANAGEVPSIVPELPVTKPGNISGVITGLEPGDAAVIFSNDPVSQPFIVVAPPEVETTTTEETTTETEPGIEFRIDNVPPGDWSVRVVASGYSVLGDTIASLNEVSSSKALTVSSDTQTTVDFTVQRVGWSPAPINASGNIGSSDQVSGSVDGSGDVHIVWRQDGADTNEDSGSVLYSRWNGKTWSNDHQFISPPGEKLLRGSRWPSLAVGVDRSPHVVWSARSNSNDFTGRRIAFSRFDGVSWSKPLIISNIDPESETSADHPDIAVNPINGQIFAVWDQVNNGVKSIFLSQLQDGRWGEGIRLSNEGVQAIKPQISIGTNGIIHVIWETENASEVQYINWDGNQFSGVETVPFNQGVNGTVDRNIDSQMDRLNRLHIIRHDQDTIQYIFRSNQTWSTSEPVHEVAGVSLPVLSGAALYLDNVGNVSAAWGSALNDGTPILRYRRRTPQGWDLPGNDVSIEASSTPSAFPTPTPDPSATPAPIASSSAGIVSNEPPDIGYEDIPLSNAKIPKYKPFVAVDERGRISVIWSDSGTNPVNSDIYHSAKTTLIVEAEATQ